MKNGNDKPHAVGVGLVLKFKGEVVAVEQFQSAPRVGNADAAFFYGGLRDVVLAVAAMEDYVLFINLKADGDETGLAKTDAVFESILKKGCEKHGRHLSLWWNGREFQRNLHVVREANLHERNIVRNALNFFPQRDEVTVSVIEEIAHHL